MPRYYFHIHRTYVDHVGVELPDLQAARDEAIGAAGQSREKSLGRETLAPVGYGVAVRK